MSVSKRIMNTIGYLTHRLIYVNYDTVRIGFFGSWTVTLFLCRDRTYL